MNIVDRAAFQNHVAHNARRQQGFFASRQPGLLVYPYTGTYTPPAFDDPRQEAGLRGHVYRAIIQDDQRVVPDENAINRAVGDFLREFRTEMARQARPYFGDAIPAVHFFYDLAWTLAMVTVGQPQYHGGVWWLEPNLDWPAIDRLRFDPDNPYLVTARYVYQALWRQWDEDFWTIPLMHRSPLDLANGIRGNELFLELHSEPARVKGLLDWCVDWQLQAEQFVRAGITVRDGWGSGVMNTWGPDKAVWVNGDPVGMISGDMMREFEQPYTGRLFRATGGGFFHNHTLGLYQVDQVARTANIHFQQFAKDPNKPTVEEALLKDPAARDRIVAASRQTPIMISDMAAPDLNRLLPILREGRFILQVHCQDEAEMIEVAGNVRTTGVSQ